MKNGGTLWFCTDEDKARLRVGQIIVKGGVRLRVRSISRDCVDLRPLDYGTTGSDSDEIRGWKALWLPPAVIAAVLTFTVLVVYWMAKS